jgi:hypothetical protein
MRALIYKDIVSLKKALTALVGIVLVLSFVFFTRGQVHLLPLFFVLIPIILVGLFFGKDTLSNVDQYIIPSPVRRSTIVLSRYVIVWALAAMGTAIVLIIQLFGKSGTFIIPWYILLPGSFILTSLISAIQMPLMYKFGAEKGRIIFVFLYFVVFSLFSYIGENKELLGNIVEKISQTNTVTLGTILALLAIIINHASYAISVYIYSSKEF